MKRITIFTIMFLCLVTRVPALYADEGTSVTEPKFVFVCRSQNHSVHAKASPIILKLYNKLGYKVSFVDLPNKRSLFNAQFGKCFAEVGRIKSASSLKNIILSDVPVHFIRARAYSLSDKVKTWKDLKYYSVGAIRGELYAKKHLDPNKTFFSNSYEDLFTLLYNKKVDLVVGLDDAVENLALHDDVVVSEVALFEAPLYHILNIKNKALMPQVNKVLKEIMPEVVKPVE